MRGRRWYPVLVLILAALSCAEPLPEPYRRGDLVPVLLLQDRERHLSLDRGRSWFILYFAEDTAQAVSRAVYLDRLVERLDNSRLGAVAVISTKAGSLLDGFATVELDYPVFLDRGNRYSRPSSREAEYRISKNHASL